MFTAGTIALLQIKIIYGIQCVQINITIKYKLKVFSILINPIKAGGSESMCRLGGRTTPPPCKKALQNVKMHVHSPIFQGQLIENKLDR